MPLGTQLLQKHLLSTQICLLQSIHKEHVPVFWQLTALRPSCSVHAAFFPSPALFVPTFVSAQ